jgi:poly(A) polymerase
VWPGTIEDDVWRRDFTINALLADPLTGEVRDITRQGLLDLESRLLRTPLAPAQTFAEDPLRMLRAIRFAVTLDFAVHPDITPAVRANVGRLDGIVSQERVREELRRMILSDHPGAAIRFMQKTGLLDHLMPEVAAMQGVEQTGFHADDVLEHTLEALDFAARRPDRAQSPADELVVRLGILFHDVGKPQTAAREGERITFLGHPDVGARLAATMLRRLRFSNDVIEAVTRVVQLHMRPIQYEPESWSDGAVRRLVRDADRLLPALLEVARADMAASDYPPAEAARKLGDLEHRIGVLDADVVRAIAPSLSGDDLMRRYGRGGGPWIGRVQKALVEAILDGELPPGDAGAAWDFVAAHPELVGE